MAVRSVISFVSIFGTAMPSRAASTKKKLSRLRSRLRHLLYASKPVRAHLLTCICSVFVVRQIVLKSGRVP